jgi:hypothetical protein
MLITIATFTNPLEAQAYPVLTRFFVVSRLALLFFLLIRGMYYLCRITGINPLCG